MRKRTKTPRPRPAKKVIRGRFALSAPCERQAQSRSRERDRLISPSDSERTRASRPAHLVVRGRVPKCRSTARQTAFRIAADRVTHDCNGHPIGQAEDPRRRRVPSIPRNRSHVEQADQAEQHAAQVSQPSAADRGDAPPSPRLFFPASTADFCGCACSCVRRIRADLRWLPGNAGHRGGHC